MSRKLSQPESQWGKDVMAKRLFPKEVIKAVKSKDKPKRPQPHKPA